MYSHLTTTVDNQFQLIYSQISGSVRFARLWGSIRQQTEAVARYEIDDPQPILQHIYCIQLLLDVKNHDYADDKENNYKTEDEDPAFL